MTRKSKVLLNLNKPGCMGMCILDFSKVLMYEFYYDSLKINDNKSKLLFIGNDSLMYKIKTEDVYQDFSSNKGMFGFSN